MAGALALPQEEEEARIAAEKQKKEEEEYAQWKDEISVEDEVSDSLKCGDNFLFAYLSE